MGSRSRRSKTARPAPAKGGGLPEPVTGLVLLLSLLLWSPVLRPLLAGQTTVAEAGVRYAAALLLAWAGCAAIVGLVRAYAQEPEDDGGAQPAAAAPQVGEDAGETGPPRRRAGDLTEGPAGR